MDEASRIKHYVKIWIKISLIWKMSVAGGGVSKPKYFHDTHLHSGAPAELIRRWKHVKHACVLGMLSNALLNKYLHIYTNQCIPFLWHYVIYRT